MVKSYLKFEHVRSFGIVTSNTSNLIWSSQPQSGTGVGQAIVAANEDVLCWDIKKGELLSRWHDEKNKFQATAMAASEADKDIVAVGYEDGTIRLWDSRLSTPIVSFNGHRSAVTHLGFDKSGARLASGSKDTDVIIWDLVAEEGLFKLRGHNDQITGLVFVEPEPRLISEDNANEDSEALALANMALTDNTGNSLGFLITTGKDSLIKLWDLTSRHCIETHIAQTNGECSALGLAPDKSTCITASNDGELQIWAIDMPALALSMQQVDSSAASARRHFLIQRGTLYRQGKDRAVEIKFHPRKSYFAVHGIEKSVEIWRERSQSEIKKALARKRRRRREKKAAKAGGGDADQNDDDDDAVDAEDIAKADVAEVFVPHVIVRTSGKVRSVDWATGSSVRKELQLLVGTSNNQIELYNISTKKDRASRQNKKDSSRKKKDMTHQDDEDMLEYSRSYGVDLPGHRADIRSISLSSDDKMLATAANGSLKIWNVRTQACIRTFECGYALCCAFLPGDKVVVVGTKSGALELFDVASAALIDSVAAHEGHAIWSLHVHPDGRSVVTGSADKTAKFWDFKIVQEPVLGTTRTTPRLKLVQTRLLKVADDILSLRFSPDAKLLAVALLDNTVKVFFVDSLKLYLNLYGHKLPVLSMDISYDSKLIVTSSADKNVKIWGLDFGDCHRSLFAHQDSILQVVFVPHNQDGNGHHFFSCGKDRAIKYWDGDKFEQIQRLDGHFGEIWALAVSHSGNLLVSASHDKSIRVWEETDEQIFLEEEREREVEELYESTLTRALDRDVDPEDMQEDGQLMEVGVASKQTVETLMAGERIAEALELGMADLNLLEEWKLSHKSKPQSAVAPPQRHIVFTARGNISAEEHVLSVLQRIPAAALHDALLVLPFAQVSALFTFLNLFALRQLNMPLTCRVLFFMLKTHHKQIVANRTMRTMLDGLRDNLRHALERQKDEMGHNMAALRVVGTQVREQAVKKFRDDGHNGYSDAMPNRRKRTFVDVA